MVGFGGTVYTLVYADHNRLAEITSGNTLLASYSYRASGRHIIKTAGSIVTHFHFGPDGNPIAQSDAPAARAIAEQIGGHYELVLTRPNGQQLAEIAGWCADGWIKPLIEWLCPLGEAKTAYAYLASGRAKGKVVVSMGLH